MAADAIRVILLGKTGSGKSSLGNSMCGDKLFTVGRGMRSETVSCKWIHFKRGPDVIELIDTPGLCDTHEPEENIYREVGKSVAVASPGPHIILLALRCDRRFTDEEFLAYRKLKELFSEEMKNFLVVVFNGMDEFGSTVAEQRKALKEEISRMSGNLRTVLDDAKNRYIGMNNNAEASTKQQLAGDVIKLIKDTVRANKNSVFTTRIIWDINSYMDGLIQSRAVKEKVSRYEAEQAIKKAISDEQERAAVEQLEQFVNGMRTRVLMTEMCHTQ